MIETTNSICKFLSDLNDSSRDTIFRFLISVMTCRTKWIIENCTLKLFETSDQSPNRHFRQEEFNFSALYLVLFGRVVLIARALIHSSNHY